MPSDNLTDSLTLLLKNHTNLRNISLHCESLYSTPDNLSSKSQYEEHLRAVSGYAVQGLSALIYQVNRAALALQGELESCEKGAKEVLGDIKEVSERFDMSGHLVGIATVKKDVKSDGWRKKVQRQETRLIPTHINPGIQVNVSDFISPAAESFTPQPHRPAEPVPPPASASEPPKIPEPPVLDDARMVARGGVAVGRTVGVVIPASVEAGAILKASGLEVGGGVGVGGRGSRRVSAQDPHLQTDYESFAFQAKDGKVLPPSPPPISPKTLFLPPPPLSPPPQHIIERANSVKIQPSGLTASQVEVEGRSSVENGGRSFREELVEARRRLGGERGDVTVSSVRHGGGGSPPPPPPPPPPLGMVSPIPNVLGTEAKTEDLDLLKHPATSTTLSFQDQLRQKLAQKASQETPTPDTTAFAEKKRTGGEEGGVMDFQAQLKAKLRSRELKAAAMHERHSDGGDARSGGKDDEDSSVSVKDRWRRLEGQTVGLGTVQVRSPTPNTAFLDAMADTVKKEIKMIETGKELDVSEKKDEENPISMIGPSPSSRDVLQYEEHNNVPIAKVIADYQSTGPGQLTIRVGDVIRVHSWEFGEGWGYGELEGVEGIFPHSYVDRS
ncbi:hypothetical protein HDU67_006560 [Dinochytrium kinnereticum]|nr:hypothetical protein HDU67_006560 [Dinochytrium kinnereticum]